MRPSSSKICRIHYIVGYQVTKRLENTPFSLHEYFFLLLQLWVFQISYNYNLKKNGFDFIGQNESSTAVKRDSKYPKILRFSRKIMHEMVTR